MIQNALSLNRITNASYYSHVIISGKYGNESDRKNLKIVLNKYKKNKQILDIINLMDKLDKAEIENKNN